MADTPWIRHEAPPWLKNPGLLMPEAPSWSAGKQPAPDVNPASELRGLMEVDTVGKQIAAATQKTEIGRRAADVLQNVPGFGWARNRKWLVIPKVSPYAQMGVEFVEPETSRPATTETSAAPRSKKPNTSGPAKVPLPGGRNLKLDPARKDPSVAIERALDAELKLQEQRLGTLAHCHSFIDAVVTGPPGAQADRDADAVDPFDPSTWFSDPPEDDDLDEWLFDDPDSSFWGDDEDVQPPEHYVPTDERDPRARRAGDDEPRPFEPERDPYIPWVDPSERDVPIDPRRRGDFPLPPSFDPERMPGDRTAGPGPRLPLGDDYPTDGPTPTNGPTGPRAPKFDAPLGEDPYPTDGPTPTDAPTGPTPTDAPTGPRRPKFDAPLGEDPYPTDGPAIMDGPTGPRAPKFDAPLGEDPYPTDGFVPETYADTKVEQPALPAREVFSGAPAPSDQADAETKVEQPALPNREVFGGPPQGAAGGGAAGPGDGAGGSRANPYTGTVEKPGSADPNVQPMKDSDVVPRPYTPDKQGDYDDLQGWRERVLGIDHSRPVSMITGGQDIDVDHPAAPSAASGDPLTPNKDLQELLDARKDVQQRLQKIYAAENKTEWNKVNVVGDAVSDVIDPALTPIRKAGELWNWVDAKIKGKEIKEDPSAGVGGQDYQGTVGSLDKDVQIERKILESNLKTLDQEIALNRSKGGAHAVNQFAQEQDLTAQLGLVKPIVDNALPVAGTELQGHVAKTIQDTGLGGGGSQTVVSDAQKAALRAENPTYGPEPAKSGPAVSETPAQPQGEQQSGSQASEKSSWTSSSEQPTEKYQPGEKQTQRVDTSPESESGTARSEQATQKYTPDDKKTQRYAPDQETQAKRETSPESGTQSSERPTKTYTGAQEEQAKAQTARETDQPKPEPPPRKLTSEERAAQANAVNEDVNKALKEDAARAARGENPAFPKKATFNPKEEAVPAGKESKGAPEDPNALTTKPQTNEQIEAQQRANDQANAGAGKPGGTQGSSPSEAQTKTYTPDQETQAKQETSPAAGTPSREQPTKTYTPEDAARAKAETSGPARELTSEQRAAQEKAVNQDVNKALKDDAARAARGENPAFPKKETFVPKEESVPAGKESKGAPEDPNALVTKPQSREQIEAQQRANDQFNANAGKRGANAEATPDAGGKGSTQKYEPGEGPKQTKEYTQGQVEQAKAETSPNADKQTKPFPKEETAGGTTTITDPWSKGKGETTTIQKSGRHDGETQAGQAAGRHDGETQEVRPPSQQEQMDAAVKKAQDQAKVEFHDQQITKAQQEKWNSLSTTPYDPNVTEINSSKAIEQMNKIVDGTLKTGKTPTAAIDALYKQYEDALKTVDRGQKRMDDYWDRMRPEQREYLQSISGDNKIPKSKWLDQLKDKK